ncbi:MAG: DedA family protein [Leptolinea sp.]
MSDISSYLLTWVISYGPPVIAVILLLGGIGIPVPASLMVIAAGAFSQQGILDPITACIVGFFAVIVGDSISYLIGKKAGGLMTPRLVSEANLNRAGNLFEKFGGGMIVITRSILSALAFPTNLIAGSSAYPFSKYLVFDMAGELVWILGYGSLGYVFGAEWETISDLLSNMGGFLAAILIIAVPGYLLFKKHSKNG